MKIPTVFVVLVLLLSISSSGATKPNFFKALFEMGSREATATAIEVDDAEEPEKCPGINCPTGWCCPLPDWICCEGHAEYCASSKEYCP